MSLIDGRDSNGVKNPAFMDTSVATLNKGKRNSLQPSRTSVMKKQSLVVGDQDILSPNGTQHALDKHQGSNEPSDIESRHQISGMETQTNEKTLAGQEAWNVTASGERMRRPRNTIDEEMHSAE